MTNQDEMEVLFIGGCLHGQWRPYKGGRLEEVAKVDEGINYRGPSDTITPFDRPLINTERYYLRACNSPVNGRPYMVGTLTTDKSIMESLWDALACPAPLSLKEVQENEKFDRAARVQVYRGITVSKEYDQNYYLLRTGNFGMSVSTASAWEDEHVAKLIDYAIDDLLNHVGTKGLSTRPNPSVLLAHSPDKAKEAPTMWQRFKSILMREG